VEKESAAKLKAKADTISRLKTELEELTLRYQNMRERTLTDSVCVWRGDRVEEGAHIL
jgi:hypothetical protein